MRSASRAESPEMAMLWRSFAEEQRFYSETLNSALNSLAARISFFNLLTALIVSSVALFATVIIGILQIHLTASN